MKPQQNQQTLIFLVLLLKLEAPVMIEEIDLYAAYIRLKPAF